MPSLMNELIIAPYVAVLALIFVVLSVRTLSLRRKLGAGVGDGGSQKLVKAVRAHANFAEYTPCLLYTSPSPRDATLSRMPSSA